MTATRNDQQQEQLHTTPPAPAQMTSPRHFAGLEAPRQPREVTVSDSQDQGQRGQIARLAWNRPLMQVNEAPPAWRPFSSQPSAARHVSHQSDRHARLGAPPAAGAAGSAATPTRADRKIVGGAGGDCLGHGAQGGMGFDQADPGPMYLATLKLFPRRLESGWPFFRGHRILLTLSRPMPTCRISSDSPGPPESRGSLTD